MKKFQMIATAVAMQRLISNRNQRKTITKESENAMQENLYEIPIILV